MRGVWSVRDLTYSAGRLHRHDFVRARHVLRPWRLRFRFDHAAHRRPDPGGVYRHAADHNPGRGGDRRHLRAAEGDLLRLCHAGVSDADPQHDIVVDFADRRRPGFARRYSASGVFRHRFVEPDASVHRELRAAGGRTSADASDRAIAVRLHLAHDPRQRQSNQLHRHRRLARQADDLRAGGAVCLYRRHHHEPVRVGRLSRIRLLDDFGRGHLHQHARRRHHLPGPDGRDGAAVDPQRHRHAAHRVLRHRARHRDPVFRDRLAQRSDGFHGRVVRTASRRREGACIAMLEVRHLSKSFGGVKAADDITLSFAEGSLTAVIGPNGAGKSTFFNLITGALRPDSGHILLNGVDMAGRSPPDIVRHGIGRAFQVARIFPSLTVHETMLAAVGADQRRASVLHRRFPLAETRDRAELAMEVLGLTGKRDRTAATLSHGDQKLLDIALALVLDPQVLLLDEPTAGMGTEERWRMIDQVHELWERQKITVVFIEHDMDIVFKIAPRVVVLCYGRILATGTPDAIRQNPAVIEAYLGTERHAEAAV